jgi:hypothetical protein
MGFYIGQSNLESCVAHANVHPYIQCLFSGEKVAVFVSRLINPAMMLHFKFQLLSMLKGF